MLVLVAWVSIAWGMDAVLTAPAPAAAEVNLARVSGVTATQSSRLEVAVVGQAINGNTSGGPAYVFNLSQPSWQVDLGERTQIDRIRLFNNEIPCCQAFTTNFHVFVSEVPFTGMTVAASQAQAGVHNFHHPGQMERPTPIPINRRGRYVRVQ